MNNKLKFGTGNAKLSKAIGIFSLPAGWTCPCAKDCLSKANKDTGAVKDGPHTKFRCFAASAEVVFRPVREKRWYNLDLLKSVKTIDGMANLINESLPEQTYIRIHDSGDFFNEDYFIAWLNVALHNPTKIFYGYTKTLSYLVKYKKLIPSNFRFSASKGGKQDDLIKKHNLVYAEVVYSVKEAEEKGLEIDHDDSHAIDSKKSFALLLHGTQPAKSKASVALQKLKAQGIGSYGKGNAKVIVPVKITNKIKPLQYA